MKKFIVSIRAYLPAVHVCALFVLMLHIVSAESYTLDDAITAHEEAHYSHALEILHTLDKTPLVQKHLAWMYALTGEYDNALELFKQLDLNNYEILFGIALTCYLKKDYETAYDYCTRCLIVHKNCAAAEYFKGLICIEQKRPHKALAHFLQTLKLDYNLTEARLMLARTFDILKDYDASYREWTTITRIDSKLEEAFTQQDKLLAYITKKPEEIIPPQRIQEASKTIPIASADKIPILRVGIAEGIEDIVLWSPKGLRIYAEKNLLFESSTDEHFFLHKSSPLFSTHASLIIEPKSPSHGIVIQDIHYGKGFAWAGISDRQYRGTCEIRCTPSGMNVINIINVEEYLYAVLPSEMIASWPLEALKAQAVIARTQAFYRRDISKPHRKAAYHICSDQHCQVYKGVKQEQPASTRAVNETCGEILVCKGRMVNTLFSSNCSGHTQSSIELKGWGYEPYLQATVCGNIEFPITREAFDEWIKQVPQIFCAPSKYTYFAESRWMRVIMQDDLSKNLNRIRTIGKIKKIIPLKRSHSGHINHIRIEGTNGHYELEKENVIRSLVLGKLRSTNFIVEGYGGKSGIPAFFIFWGGGWGHAVGLCQSGAAGMAAEGYKYTDILYRYYKDTNIKKLNY